MASERLDGNRLDRGAQARTGGLLTHPQRGHSRFTLDRLVGIINWLGARVEVKLKVKPAARSGYPVPA